jgi:hypothetical protein
MRYSIISSLILHLGIILMAVISLPIFNDPELDMTPIIQVELIEIAEKTNVPEVSKKQEKKPEKKDEKKKEDIKVTKPIIKPKDEKSNEIVKDPVEEEEIVKEKIEKKMLENLPIKKPIEKKEDKYDPLKLFELIDKQEDAKTIIEDVEDLGYEAIEVTPSLVNRIALDDEAAIRAQFMYCWSLDAGRIYDDTDIVSIKIFLNIDGSHQKLPEIIESHRNRMAKPDESRYKILAEGALRAVRRCDPLTTVPNIDEYDIWKEMQLNFDPREKLR